MRSCIERALEANLRNSYLGIVKTFDGQDRLDEQWLGVLEIQVHEAHLEDESMSSQSISSGPHRRGSRPETREREKKKTHDGHSNQQTSNSFAHFSQIVVSVRRRYLGGWFL